MKYALITAARNEERFIETTIQSVVAQTSLPEHSPTVDQIQEKVFHLRRQANATAKHLLTSFCTGTA